LDSAPGFGPGGCGSKSRHARLSIGYCLTQNKNAYTKGCLFALLSSASYAIWAILSLIIVNNNGIGSSVSLDSIYIPLLIIAWILVLVYRKKKGVFSLPMIKRSVMIGLIYTGGTLSLFYALSYAKAFPLTMAASSAGLIVFAFLVRKRNKSKASLKYFISTLVAFAGIAIITFGIYGSGFVFNPIYIASLLPPVLLYGLAGYYSFRAMEEKYDPVGIQAVGMTAQTLSVSAIILALGLAGEFDSLTQQAWIYATIIAIFLAVGYLAELKAFDIIKKAKAGAINTVNILSSLEFVGVATYSIIFLSLNWLDMVLGGALLLSGIALLQTVE